MDIDNYEEEEVPVKGRPKDAFRSTFNMGLQHFERFAARWEWLDGSYQAAMLGDYVAILNLINALEWFKIQFIGIDGHAEDTGLIVDPQRIKKLSESMRRINELKLDWVTRRNNQPGIIPDALLEECKLLYALIWTTAHILNLGLDLEKGFSRKAMIERGFVNG